MQPDVKVPAAIVATGSVVLTDRDTVTSLTCGGTLTQGNGDAIGTSTHAWRSRSFIPPARHVRHQATRPAPMTG